MRAAEGPARTPHVLPLAVGAWAATAGCTLLRPAVSGEIAGALMLLATATIRRRIAVSLVALGGVLGAGAAAWHVHGLLDGPVASLAARRADVQVVARLVRDPAAASTMTGTPLMVTDATVTAVAPDDGAVRPIWRSTNAPVLVLSYGRGWAGLLPGQRVQVTGSLSPPRRGDSVAAVLDARGPPILLGRPSWLQRGAGRVRAALRGAVSGLPVDERGLLPGLVDGDVAAMPASLQVDMRVAGLTHLQAVSGENVAVILAVSLALARGVGLRRRSRIFVCTVALLGFVVLARPSPSVLRAAVMGGAALLAMALGRRTSALPAVSLAVLLLVVVNPFLARSVGFVLSVVATVALVTLAPPWTRWLSQWLPRPIAAAIAIPAAAQLACTPVLILAFGQLTPYAIPANLLAAPAVPPATVIGVVCAVVASVSEPVGHVVAWFAALPTAMIALVARAFAAMPGSGLRWSAAAGLALLGVAAAIAMGIALRRGLGSWTWGRPGRRAILGAWQR